MKASEKQIGGNHYKDMAIQPGDFIRKNGLGWYEGNAVKYLCRHQAKGGKQDLEKAKHYVELAIEEYDDMPPINPETGLASNNKHGYPSGSYEGRRSQGLKKCYGITLKEWESLFDEQGRVCAICGSDEPRGKNWHTDHCHDTKVVRGILCGWCNTGIGKLQEDVEVLSKAASYICRYKAKGGKEDIKKAIHYLELVLEEIENVHTNDPSLSTSSPTSGTWTVRDGNVYADLYEYYSV